MQTRPVTKIAHIALTEAERSQLINVMLFTCRNLRLLELSTGSFNQDVMESIINKIKDSILAERRDADKTHH